MNSPVHVQQKLQELEHRIQALGAEILTHTDYAIEAIEMYQKDPSYYERLVQKRNDLTAQLRDLKRKAQEIT